jgi:hypothetical protein
MGCFEGEPPAQQQAAPSCCCTGPFAVYATYQLVMETVKHSPPCPCCRAGLLGAKAIAECTWDVKAETVPPSVCCRAGLFGVYAVADSPGDHEDLTWAIMHELTKMCYTVR